MVVTPLCTFKIVELPNFDGSDPIRWIAKSIKSEVKVFLAFICMEGVVVHWFKYLRKRQLYMTWEGLRPTGWVEEFVQQFEMLLTQLDGYKRSWL
ncbi:hypothetical protein CR513_15925, partial [Mucuna pruriens]